MSQKETTSLSNGRKILLGLALVFVLPFTIAATLHLLNLSPASHSYGDLVKPPKALKFTTLHDTQGKDFNAQQWLKIWSVVMVDTTGCTASCQAQVHLLKQVHTTLAKDAKRVQRVLLVPGHLQAEAFAALQTQYPDLIILGGADTETANFASQFSVNAQIAGNVYLVDPLGNLMMSYSKNQNPKGMQSDMKRLLKNSWAG
jgi:cytochrome oxidase Cu insertion factor (SCO1/SenC/PrrC family)